MQPTHTYIDLFAGCGGLSLGLHHAGWRGLFAIEKSPDAFATLKYNLIDNKNHFDWPEWLPQSHLEIDQAIATHADQFRALQGTVDLVAGGPPCQGFSSAGRRKEDDKRNNLVNSYIEFIRLVMPKLILFENVKGFTLAFKKNADKGKEYASLVEKELDDANYHVKGHLVDFGAYGIPQRRTRFILVGIRKDVPGASPEVAESFFQQLFAARIAFLKERGLTPETTLQDAISDLLKANGSEDFVGGQKGFKIGVYSEPKSAYQRLMRKGITHKVADSHRFPNHRPDIVNKFAFIQKYCAKNKDVDEAARNLFDIKKHTIIPLACDQKSPTITTLPDDYIHYAEPRILTVREYARIQSFPDWYEFQGKYTTGGPMRTKEVPRYTQIGNAIPPLFGEQSGLVLQKLIK